jgi:hypothetical protein
MPHVNPTTKTTQIILLPLTVKHLFHPRPPSNLTPLHTLPSMLIFSNMVALTIHNPIVDLFRIDQRYYRSYAYHRKTDLLLPSFDLVRCKFLEKFWSLLSNSIRSIECRLITKLITQMTGNRETNPLSLIICH